MINKGQANSGSFITGWRDIKQCIDCKQDFMANSGIQRFCNECKSHREVCPECKGQKSIYDVTCGNSCAGKIKYRNSEKVRNAIEIGRIKAHKNASERTKRALTGKPNLSIRGNKNPNWKGGSKSIRRSTQVEELALKNWRRGVFSRDKYTCQYCGEVGGILNAHHIREWAKYPELRLELNNGLTLCIVCHKGIHRKRS